MADIQSKTKWTLDPAHSIIDFRVKHLMIAHVKGSFKKFEAVVYTDGHNFKTAEIDFSCEPASVDTHDPQRDKHLQSAEFFDADKFSKISFKGKTAKKGSDDSLYELIGDLTIKGISKPVRLDAEFGGLMKDPWGNEKAGFTITGKVNRKDWGLAWNAPLETGGVLVGEEVKIMCEVELMKAKAMEAKKAEENTADKEMAAE
ncbi:MAG: YceI family protein [Bacteroidia bacterium]